MATPVTSLDQYRQAHSANVDALPAQNPFPETPGFRLTASALTWLVNDGMSQLLVDKLAEKLQDQPFDKEGEFWAAVKTAIGEDVMKTNKPLIWEYAVNPILAEMKTMLTAKPCFRLARSSLRWLLEDGVPEEVLKSLSALQDQAFENEADFLNAVQTQIGEASTTQYKALIWKYAADNSALKEFFRNQQRFIHLYLLSQGCKVTSQIIKKLMENLDRTFAPQTYYGLRRELNEEQWIQEDKLVPNTSRGPTEFPHFIPEEKREKFLETVIAASTIERPVVISKFHVFDLAVNLFKKKWDALLPIVKQAQGTFFTDFVVQELTRFVLELREHIHTLIVENQQLATENQQLKKEERQPLTATNQQLQAQNQQIATEYQKLKERQYGSRTGKVVNLFEWLQDNFDEDWNELRVANLKSPLESHPNLKERAKVIDLVTDVVRLAVQIIFKDNDNKAISLRVFPVKASSLPIGLKMIALDTTGHPLPLDPKYSLIEVNCELLTLEQRFMHKSGDSFDVQISLSGKSVIRRFKMKP